MIGEVAEIDVCALSAAALARRIRGKELRAASAVRSYLDRIEASTLNAVVTLDPSAEEMAARSDASLSEGRLLGPLHGVPFTVKDTLDTAGVRTTAGSATLASRVPEYSATVVTRLQATGAILLGKTNCSEFAVDTHTDNPLFGATLNPRDRSRTAGGSSGGEAAAVADGLSAFGVGTDFGGSIRWPAQCTGVFSLRPTPGLVPGTGILPCLPENRWGIPNQALTLHRLMTAGPITRTAEDLGLILSVMAGPDGLDTGAMQAPPPSPEMTDPTKLKIVWCDGEGTIPVAKEVARAVAAAAEALKRAGLTVRRQRPDGLSEAADLFMAASNAEGMPEVEAMVAGNRSALGAFMQAHLARAKPGPFGEIVRLATERDRLRQRVLASLGDASVLLLPVAAVAAPRPHQASVDVDGREVPWSKLGVCCRAISILGFPSASVPWGRSAVGLPISVQVVGRPFGEASVLAVAALLETAAEVVWNPGARYAPMSGIRAHTRSELN